MFKIFVSGRREDRDRKLRAAAAIIALGYAPYVGGEFSALAGEGVGDEEWWEKVDAEFMIECDAFYTVSRDGDPHFETAEEYGVPIFYSTADLIEFISQDHPMFSSVCIDEDPDDPIEED